MSFFGGLFKGIAALVVSVLAFGILSGKAVPTASFTMTPDGNPVVGQEVQFTDTSTGGPTSWSWNFGDGQSSTLQSPTHAYGGPGPFMVTLTATNGSGSAQATQSLIVSTNDTLRLNNKGNNSFTVTLLATDQHHGSVSVTGHAIPQNDVFGYFSFPPPTGSLDNPEVFVKILDGRAINGEFWVFYGHLTDLIYDLSVTEVSTGLTKTYHKNAGVAAGDADTSGFHPTPTLTPTPPTATPTPTPTAPALIVTNLVASNFAWNFDGNGPEFTMHVGQAYRLQISRVNGTTHAFSGLQKSTDFSDLGCGGSALTSTKICNISPTTANIGDYFFACTVSTCGTGHDNMLNGKITVVP